MQSTSTSNTNSQSASPKPATTEAEQAPVTSQHQKDNTADDTGKSEEAKKVQANDNDSHNASDKTNSALALTHEALFAKRYVTAEKFGQASNDPRVVRSQQVQATQQPPVAEPAVVSPSTIRGTVGDFVRKALTDAESRLKNDGVISCFIAAIDAHTQQAKSANVETNVTPTADTKVEDSNFDFSNYGYQPLAADYLTRFETMTQAVSQFAATQGKTDVEPRAIGKRAGNDPRGQHPSYQEPAVLSLPTEQAADTEQAVIEHDDNNVDAHDVEANALANQAQADNISADSEQLLEADQALVEATNEPSNEGTVIAEHVAAKRLTGHMTIAKLLILKRLILKKLTLKKLSQQMSLR